MANWNLAAAASQLGTPPGGWTGPGAQGGTPGAVRFGIGAAAWLLGPAPLPGG